MYTRELSDKRSSLSALVKPATLVGTAGEGVILWRRLFGEHVVVRGAVGGKAGISMLIGGKFGGSQAHAKFDNVDWTGCNTLALDEADL
jgi:hypothetical protein